MSKIFKKLLLSSTIIMLSIPVLANDIKTNNYIEYIKNNMQSLPEISNNNKVKDTLNISFSYDIRKPTRANLHNIFLKHYAMNDAKNKVNCNININEKVINKISDNKLFLEFAIRHEIQHCINEDNKLFNNPYFSKEQNNGFKDVFLTYYETSLSTIQHENKADTGAILMLMKEKENKEELKELLDIIIQMRINDNIDEKNYVNISYETKNTHTFLLLDNINHHTLESLNIIKNNFDTIFNNVKKLNIEEIDNLAVKISSIGLNNLLAKLQINTKNLNDTMNNYIDNMIYSNINNNEYFLTTFNKDFEKTINEYIKEKNINKNNIFTKKYDKNLNKVIFEKGKLYNDFIIFFLNKNKDYQEIVDFKNKKDIIYSNSNLPEKLKYNYVYLDENLNFNKVNSNLINFKNNQQLNNELTINYNIK